MKTRILIVDDEASFIKPLAKRLKFRDYDVSSALSGKEALEKMKSYHVDVVILDVLMPEMDGIETLREMKKESPLTEVIMLTGHASVESAIEGMKLGAFDYLMKPCETDALIAKITQAYERKSQHEERIREAKVKKFVSSPRSALKDE